MPALGKFIFLRVPCALAPISLKWRENSYRKLDCFIHIKCLEQYFTCRKCLSLHMLLFITVTIMTTSLLSQMFHLGWGHSLMESVSLTCPELWAKSPAPEIVFCPIPKLSHLKWLQNKWICVMCMLSFTPQRICPWYIDRNHCQDYCCCCCTVKRSHAVYGSSLAAVQQPLYKDLHNCIFRTKVISVFSLSLDCPSHMRVVLLLI